MIDVQISFSFADAIRFFRANNIQVEEVPVKTLFGDSNNKNYFVINPANGQKLPLEKAFRAIMDSRIKTLMFDNVDKFSIYQTLNNLK